MERLLRELAMERLLRALRDPLAAEIVLAAGVFALFAVAMMGLLG